jgi:hypothetical protein
MLDLLTLSLHDFATTIMMGVAGYLATSDKIGYQVVSSRVVVPGALS